MSISRLAVSLVAVAGFIFVACAKPNTPGPAQSRQTEVTRPATATSSGRPTEAASPATATPSASPTASPSPKPAVPTATPTTATAPSGGLPTGPGPLAHYAVEPQPPAGSCHYTLVDSAAGELLPDPACTPGAVSPGVTQANLASTICKKGYTKSVRPPEDVTDAEKDANAASYGYTGSFKTAEYDHFIPLELGGDPNDSRNLWVEPNKSSATTVNNPKDGVESSLNYLVCNAIHGKPYLPLAIAQRLIATNWTTAKANAQHFLVSN